MCGGAFGDACAFVAHPAHAETCPFFLIGLSAHAMVRSMSGHFKAVAPLLSTSLYDASMYASLLHNAPAPASRLLE